MGLTIDPGQYKNKIDYYHNFKTNSQSNRCNARVMCQKGQHKIKRVIIILKIILGFNLGQGPRHKSGGSTPVNPGQCKDKICYYHNFKTQLGGQSGQGPGHKSKGLTRVDQVNIWIRVIIIMVLKPDPRVEVQVKAKFKSWFRRVNPANPNWFF